MIKMNFTESSNKKITRLSRKIGKKQKQIEKMRTKRKQHRVEDHKFLSKKKRIEDQIQSMKMKIDTMH
jgi:hypothetical protein